MIEAGRLDADRVTAVVLAAGASSRFGAPKLLARLGDRPVLQHVLDVAAACGFGEVIVVVGHAATEIEASIDWRAERRVQNPDPDDGLSSSLRIGIGAVGAGSDAALILLGDQPLVRREVVEALLAAAGDRPVVVPRYADGGGANPVLVRREAFGLVEHATGDRGLGPILAANPDVVAAVDVPGSNPDVDTTADLAALESAPR